MHDSLSIWALLFRIFEKGIVLFHFFFFDREERPSQFKLSLPHCHVQQETELYNWKPKNLKDFPETEGLVMGVFISCRYKAVYRYMPQNEDELELQEGDTVYVMEKCDDGWYVGTSERTKEFGTFPGNYVQPLW